MHGRPKQWVAYLAMPASWVALVTDPARKPRCSRHLHAGWIDAACVAATLEPILPTGGQIECRQDQPR
jgi:hypothetical protein